MSTYTAKHPALAMLLNVRLAFALLALLALLVGRFWWFGETTSWAGFIRICLFLGMLLAIAQWRQVIPFLNGNVYAWLLLGLLAYLALNSLVLGDGKTARRVLLLLAFFIAIPLAVSNGRRFLKPLLGLMVICSALVAVVTFATLYEQGLLRFQYRVFNIKASGIAGFADFENSVLAGLELAFSAVIMIWLLLQARGWPARIFWLATGLLIGLYVFMTYSRTGWLALSSSVLVMLVCLPDRRARWRLCGAVSILALAVVAVFHERIVFELVERKLSHRDEIWRMAIDLMPGHWLFGYGADTNFARVVGLRPLGGSAPMLIAHPHSIYLEVLFNYGLFGLIGFLSVFLAACRRFYVYRHDPFALLWLAVLAGAMVAMIFDFSSVVTTPNLLWLWMWLPLGWALALAPDPGRPAAMINTDFADRSVR